MWYTINDHELYLYHYTSADTLVNHILPSGTLRFSNFSRLNDPREYKIFNMGAYSSTPLGDDFLAISEGMEAALKAGWKIACFVADTPHASTKGMHDTLSQKAMNTMYERGHTRPRMWAQYANRHSGACILFRKEALDRAIRAHAMRASLQVFCGHVTYKNEPFIGRLGAGPFNFSVDDIRRSGLKLAAARHAKEHFQELYLTKSEDWSAEREFRWLLLGDSDEEEFVDFQDSIAGLIIGEMFPAEFKATLGRYALKNGTPMAMMDWKRTIPQPKLTTARMLLPVGDPDRPLEGW